MIVVVETLDFRGRTLIVVEHGLVPAIIKVLECTYSVCSRMLLFWPCEKQCCAATPNLESKMGKRKDISELHFFLLS